MKQTTRFAPIGVVLLLVTALTSCERIDFHHKPNKDCQITNMKFYDYYGQPYNALFYYNRWGNPDSIRYQRVGTAEPDFTFVYDNKKRVKETIAHYRRWPDGTYHYYEMWHKYGYNNKNQVIIDTLYIFPEVGVDPEIAPHTGREISYLSYDGWGRVIKDSHIYRFPVLPPKVTSYQYDARGNRVIPGLAYDNYINPHQLHPIWQLLDREYSVNNPIPAENYNSYLLPTKFNYPAVSVQFLYDSRKLNQSELVYTCK